MHSDHRRRFPSTSNSYRMRHTTNSAPSTTSTSHTNEDQVVSEHNLIQFLFLVFVFIFFVSSFFVFILFRVTIQRGTRAPVERETRIGRREQRGQVFPCR